MIIFLGNRENYEEYLADEGLTSQNCIHGFETNVMAGVVSSETYIDRSFHDLDVNKRKELFDYAQSRIR